MINAEDNSVTNVENEKEDDDDNDKTFKLSDAVRFEDALKVAQDKASGDLKEWSLSRENVNCLFYWLKRRK